VVLSQPSTVASSSLMQRATQFLKTRASYTLAKCDPKDPKKAVLLTFSLPSLSSPLDLLLFQYASLGITPESVLAEDAHVLKGSGRASKGHRARSSMAEHEFVQPLISARSRDDPLSVSLPVPAPSSAHGQDPFRKTIGVSPTSKRK
jgi:hypothetical protein